MSIFVKQNIDQHTIPSYNKDETLTVSYKFDLNPTNSEASRQPSAMDSSRSGLSCRGRLEKGKRKKAKEAFQTSKGSNGIRSVFRRGGRANQTSDQGVQRDQVAKYSSEKRGERREKKRIPREGGRYKTDTDLRYSK